MSGTAWSKTRRARLHDVMAGHVERGEMPGVVTLVSRRGDAQVEAIGTTAIGGRTPMQRDTIFRITSMTKPVTAAAAMILVEECRLRLDEPVDRCCPSWPIAGCCDRSRVRWTTPCRRPERSPCAIC